MDVFLASALPLAVRAARKRAERIFVHPVARQNGELSINQEHGSPARLRCLCKTDSMLRRLRLLLVFIKRSFLCSQQSAPGEPGPSATTCRLEAAPSSTAHCYFGQIVLGDVAANLARKLRTGLKQIRPSRRASSLWIRVCFYCRSIPPCRSKLSYRETFFRIRLSNAPVVPSGFVVDLSYERSGIGAETAESGRGGEARYGVRSKRVETGCVLPAARLVGSGIG
jgi:hypothetical protein